MDRVRAASSVILWMCGGGGFHSVPTGHPVSGLRPTPLASFAAAPRLTFIAKEPSTAAAASRGPDLLFLLSHRPVVRYIFLFQAEAIYTGLSSR